MVSINTTEVSESSTELWNSQLYAADVISRTKYKNKYTFSATVKRTVKPVAVTAAVNELCRLDCRINVINQVGDINTLYSLFRQQAAQHLKSNICAQ